MPIIKEDFVSAKQNKTEIPQNSPSLDTPKEKSGLISTIGSLLPLAPVLFEQ